MRRRIKIIANPISGRGRARRLARRVADELRARGCDVVLAETAQAGDARRLAGKTGGFDAVCCVGGDGTVNEVANGLPQTAPPLGIIPSGTANVLAVELGLRRSAAALARTIAEGRELTWDLGVERPTGRKFLLFASAGYDAEVVRVFHARRRGPIQQWQYFWWGLKSYVDYEVPRIGVELDGCELTRRAAWVQISNVSAYGGPLVFTPRARPDDGAFEVMVQHSPYKRDVMRMFWAAILQYALGIEYRMRDVTFHQARRIRLWSADGRPVPVQIDGDPAGHLPFDGEIVPGGMRVLVP
ncbi:MAG: diacylglycerol kinase family lipid kinase [Planctomycetes bacterium]|nr:diacylglycerol kinase family lipid kinase [Planctomycetota bacterium]